MFKNRLNLLVATLLILAVAAPMMAFANGAAKFSLTRTLFVADSELKSGAYDVKWEANSSEATVTFILNRKAVATIKGKIVESPKPIDYNSLILGKDASGRESVKGLLFRDKNTTIVFE